MGVLRGKFRYMTVANGAGWVGESPFLRGERIHCVTLGLIARRGVVWVVGRVVEAERVFRRDAANNIGLSVHV